MNPHIKSIRNLAMDKQPTSEIVELSKILHNHNCLYLLSKLQAETPYTQKIKVTNALNKLIVSERYKNCENVFELFEQNHIPYAVIKGAVLSNTAYQNPYCRYSGDIDILVSRKNINIIKQLMYSVGFTQGKVTNHGIVPYSRQEVLFQASASHQMAPFVKETNNKLCPYINVDINFDIMWGESKQKTDMDLVLKHTQKIKMFDVAFQKLTPEMELISLCLHHYKDMNSLYLLYERGLDLGHFCDIYFFLKNGNIDISKLYDLCETFNVGKYIYYCLYYTNIIFKDAGLQTLLELLHSDEAEELLPCFGLDDSERHTWQIDFDVRLFDTHMKDYLENVLSEEWLNKIKINQSFM